jgi:solute carrier family 6 serotonin transporter-like protein 4
VYLVNLLNVYGPGISILFVVFVEAAGVCWFYGVDRFSRDIEQMIGHRPGIFWRVCWSYISPVFLLVSDSYRDGLTSTMCTGLKHLNVS